MSGHSVRHGGNAHKKKKAHGTGRTNATGKKLPHPNFPKEVPGREENKKRSSGESRKEVGGRAEKKYVGEQKKRETDSPRYFVAE